MPQGLQYDDLDLQTKDGVSLRCYFLPAGQSLIGGGIVRLVCSFLLDVFAFHIYYSRATLVLNHGQR